MNNVFTLIKGVHVKVVSKINTKLYNILLVYLSVTTELIGQ